MYICQLQQLVAIVVLKTDDNNVKHRGYISSLRDFQMYKSIEWGNIKNLNLKSKLKSKMWENKCQAWSSLKCVVKADMQTKRSYQDTVSSGSLVWVGELD